MPKPTVAVLITTYNGLRDTRACLASLARSERKPSHILVMDDASTDGTAKMIRDEFPGVEVVSNEVNLRYARNLNRGLERLKRFDTLLILNNDVTVAPEMLGNLLTEMDRDPTIGLCGPTMFYAHDERRIWALGGRIDRWNAHTHHHGLNRFAGRDPGSSDVDYIPGAAMLVRRRCFDEIGLFDERYEAYFEEVDFCLRLRRAGYRVVHVPGAQLWHKVSATMGGRGRPRQKYLMARNRLWCVRSRFPRPWVPVALLGDAITGAVELSRNLLLWDGASARGLFRGYCAGWGPLWRSGGRIP